MMIKLWDSGAYLIRGEELIADGADAAVQIKNKTGKEVSRDEAAQGTMAYHILKEHNLSLIHI